MIFEVIYVQEDADRRLKDWFKDQNHHFCLLPIYKLTDWEIFDAGLKKNFCKQNF